MIKKEILSMTIFLVLNVPSASYPQDFGFVLGYATSNALMVGGHLIQQKFLYRLCVSFEPSDAKGEEVTEQKPNYGRTIEGGGDYFTSYDFAMGYYLTQKMTISGEISIAQKRYYTNYIDNRFSDGGYHMIDKSETLFGFGLSAGYIFYSGFGLLIGYNSIREFSLGITYDF
jgi:hypothetical protein